jgi:hypothetical protein
MQRVMLAGRGAPHVFAEQASAGGISMKMLRMGLLLGLMGVFTACGADTEDDKGSEAPSFVGVMKSAVVTAAEGGKLEAGAATLTVPPGAVDGDLTVTVAVEAKTGKPSEKDILVDVYDFGHDGTEFKQPVELSFDMKGVKYDDEKGDVQVAWLDGDKWKVLPTTVKDGKASAETTHFTPFTIIFVLNEDGDIVQEGGQCSGEFDACGGDLVGSWDFSGACATFPNPYESEDPNENPFAMCEDKPTFAFTLDLTGTITFGADGDYQLSQTSTASISAKIPASCLTTVGGGQLPPADVCETVNGTLDGAGDCSLVDDAGEPDMEEHMGTYTAENGLVTLMSSDSDGTPDGGAGDEDEDDPAEYCVTGNMVTVRILDVKDDGTTTEVRYYATRQ